MKHSKTNQNITQSTTNNHNSSKVTLTLKRDQDSSYQSQNHLEHSNSKKLIIRKSDRLSSVRN